ncbi:carbamoyltransferase C-terminal domain-containing protein [Bowmanella yangjiangensis]|uniref:ASCH domain-containing protein n=1 Tax=Bowmanella yangjiangensis TaxID=2811230 RepID=A0ABS3CST2_9ALTE|nr:carbamoyltransferase C-terminal domain-containing protein [Bowmanella yangjiangensis]MBN7819325.1 ASCH domain-containing protein [Bowmanella yangjiangensis]
MKDKLIVGGNIGETLTGKSLADGSVCIYFNEEIAFMLAQERVTKLKHDGGFVEASKVALNSISRDLHDVDMLIVSTCCEQERIPGLQNIYPNAKIVSCNHHLSHAIGVHCLSGFDKSLVCVFDGGGNVFGNSSSPDWWKGQREQHSYFLIDGDGFLKIDDDFSEPFDMGFGEIYRAFTKYLGLGSSENAGKLMALSGFGSIHEFADLDIFSINDQGQLTSSIRYTNEFGPKDVERIISSFLASLNVPEVSLSGKGVSSMRTAHLAAWVQHQLQYAMERKIRFLHNKYKVNNICITGGVGFNCKANGHLLRKLPEINFFVSPFSGDIGQSLGNVCFGIYKETGKIFSQKVNNTYLGTSTSIEVDEIKRFVSSNCNGKVVTINELDNIFHDVSKLLAEYKVGAIHQGRSEVGPRALGNRSILARTDCKAIKDRINYIKNRELYMPLAPVTFEDIAHKHFHLHKNFDYSFMTAAVIAKETNDNLGAVKHVDNSARIQVIPRNEDVPIAKILSQYEKLGYEPILTNTSFNPHGLPISESPQDALKYFLDMDLDFLALDNVLLTKTNDTERKNIVSEGIVCSERFYNISISELASIASAMSGYGVVDRSYFNLYEIYAKWFIEGRKITTIRFKKSKIERIESSILSLFTNKSFDDDVNVSYLMEVHVSKVVYKKYTELDEIDALNDGFNSLAELKDALLKIYGPELRNGFVSIYFISPANSAKISPRYSAS